MGLAENCFSQEKKSERSNEKESVPKDTSAVKSKLEHTPSHSNQLTYPSIDFICETYLETKELLTAQFEDFKSSGLWMISDSLAKEGKCEIALDSLTAWEMNKSDTLQSTQDLKGDLDSLDGAILKSLMELEAEEKDTVEIKPERTSIHTVSVVSNIYNSEDESYLTDSLDVNLNSIAYADSVPGETQYTVGWERKDITSNPYSFFRYTNNRLSVLNDHVYDRLENDFGTYLAKGKIDLNLNSVATLKWEYKDSTTSFFNGVLEPSIYYNPTSEIKAGIKSYNEFKTHRNQSTGYENYRVQNMSGDINYFGDFFEVSLDGSFTQKIFLDSTFKNYDWEILDLNTRYLPWDRLLLEAYINRDKLTFVNDSLGPESETAWLGEFNITYYFPWDIELSALISAKRTNFMQYDTLSSSLGPEIFLTNYRTTLRSFTPYIRIPFLENYSVESSLGYEILNVGTIDSTQWTNPDAAAYFTPKDDNYSRTLFSLYTGYSKGDFSSYLGTQFENINYQDTEFYQIPDYKTFDVLIDLSFSLKQRWNFYFSVEWPLIQYFGEDTSSDKYISMEAEYEL